MRAIRNGTLSRTDAIKLDMGELQEFLEQLKVHLFSPGYSEYSLKASARFVACRRDNNGFGIWAGKTPDPRATLRGFYIDGEDFEQLTLALEECVAILPKANSDEEI